MFLADLLLNVSLHLGLFIWLSLWSGRLPSKRCWFRDAIASLLSLLSLLAPDSTSGVISKTIEICLQKEGNSFGFVMRGGFVAPHLILLYLFILIFLVIFLQSKCWRFNCRLFLCVTIQVDRMRTGTNLALWWSHMSVQVVLLTGNAQPKIKLLKALYTETRHFIIMIM